MKAVLSILVGARTDYHIVTSDPDYIMNRQSIAYLPFLLVVMSSSLPLASSRAS